jgi:hypothetical protein
MTGAAWAVLALAMAVLVVAGAGAVALNPAAFFYGLAKMALPDLLKLLPALLKRMPPEQEDAWRACVRQGGRWDRLASDA